MIQLHGKHILLGITGGIAAYKSAELTRRLRDAGAQVQVVMTQAATEFVTPLTFQALSGNPVHTSLLDEKAEMGMGHIQLARWADALLIAPASANTLAKLTQGRADDLLTTICLATEAPIFYAPAMNRAMWHNLQTQNNCKTLVQRGYTQLGPASGAQACGETGEGRMLDVPDIIRQLASHFDTGALSGLNVVITAGPTYEPIDPVRFIGNRSSGKMGFALAQAAIEAGATVTLISGPSHLETPEDVARINIETAQQMYELVMAHTQSCDLFISAAAVADYRPATMEQQKIKKDSETMTLALTKNPDIVAAVAQLDEETEHRPFVIGFAAETESLELNAQKKLQNKKLDMIAANRVDEDDSGFNSDNNALKVYWKDGHKQLEKTRKSVLARQLIEIIARQYHLKQKHEKNTA